MDIACMFDWIMEYVMLGLKKNREQCSERWRGTLCLKIVDIIDDSLLNSPGLIQHQSSKNIWKVVSKTDDKYNVDLAAKKCGCKK